MKTIDRLRQYIEFKGISLNSFDKSINASNGYIGKQIKNNASIGADTLQIIISVYKDLNLNWLITGDGEMILNKSYTYITDENSGSVKEPASKYCLSCSEKDKQIVCMTEFINTLTRQLDEANKNTELYRMLLNEIKKEASKDDGLNKQSA